ncbi:hypothetical protein HY994_05080 [Candidatus Micrarchaeota archaeon]|nr:hypothetical protein [Candidatus Micrarchaeota archaeon]
MEKQGKALCNAALAKEYEPIAIQIKNVKKPYRQDILHKKRQWQKAAKNAIEAALQSDRERIQKGKGPLYPDLTDIVADNRLIITPMVEKSKVSLYRTFSSKAPEEEDHFDNLVDVHDIMRTQIIVDEADTEKAIRACRQARSAMENHLKTPTFPLVRVKQRHDFLDKGKSNDFHSLILELRFEGYPQGVKGLPRAELQILSRAMHEQNQLPESARAPRWNYFKSIVPGTKIATLLGIPEDT